MSRNKWKQGDIYAISLAEGWYGFCILRTFPVAEFYDVKSQSLQNFEAALADSKILFRALLAIKAINKPSFVRLKNVPVDDFWLEKTYIQDVVTGKFYIRRNGYPDAIEATEYEAKKYIWAGVHEAIHIVRRLKGELR